MTVVAEHWHRFQPIRGQEMVYSFCSLTLLMGCTAITSQCNPAPRFLIILSPSERIVLFHSTSLCELRSFSSRLGFSLSPLNRSTILSQERLIWVVWPGELPITSKSGVPFPQRLFAYCYLHHPDHTQLGKQSSWLLSLKNGVFGRLGQQFNTLTASSVPYWGEGEQLLGGSDLTIAGLDAMIMSGRVICDPVI